MSTIKDVAKHAGVAVGTVSRYLNGAHIKPQNKLGIDEAVRELGFKLNPIARGLKTSRTNTIGTIIPNMNELYSTTIIRSVEQRLYESGYHMFACDCWGSIELEKEKIQLLSDKMVDGIIIYPCSSSLSYLYEMHNFNIPVVTVDTVIEDYTCDQVVTDNIHSTYTPTQYLIDMGHRHIAYLSGPTDYFTSAHREKGYLQALSDNGIEFDSNLLYFVNSEQMSYEKSMEMLKCITSRNASYQSTAASTSAASNLPTPPTAILAWNYYSTLGLIRAVYDLGIKVPDELSIIGFDNLGLTEIVRPHLTIIAQPMHEVGRMAAELVLRRINGDFEEHASIKSFKSELVIRSSVKNLKHI